MIHKIAGMIVKDKKFLAVKAIDETVLITPGGKMEAGETVEETLRRELKEELNVKLLSMKPFLKFNCRTADGKADMIWEGHLADIEGIPEPNSEIEKLFWLDSKNFENEIEVSSVIKEKIIPKLVEMDLIR